LNNSQTIVFFVRKISQIGKRTLRVFGKELALFGFMATLRLR